jgi:hypothetical protein
MIVEGDRCAPSSTRELTRTTQREQGLRGTGLMRGNIHGCNAAERFALGERLGGDDLRQTDEERDERNRVSREHVPARDAC